MSKFVTLDAFNLTTGFYDSEINAGGIPDIAIPITDELWHEWILDTAGQQYDPATQTLSPYTPPVTKTQLLSYARGKVAQLLRQPRSYVIAGLSDPIVNDFGTDTGVLLNRAYSHLGMITYPYEWVDYNYSVWSLTRPQLKDFIDTIFGYATSVQAVFSGTAIPNIHSGAIKTIAQIDALPWP